MDVSTASGSDSDSDSNSNEAISVQSVNEDIHLKNVPAFVVWRDSDGKSHSLPDLGFSLLYTSCTKRALVRLQAITRLKKGPSKPYIYLFIKPDQISKLEFVKSEGASDRDEIELHGHARQKLNTSTHALRFELRDPATFVVPNEHPFQFFRAGSQAVWTSWNAFARDTRRFFIHFPMTTLSKPRLLSFCLAASTYGYLTSLDDNISSLYGGRGGRVVDGNDANEDNTPQNEARAGSSDENGAPPAYDAHTTAGPGLSATAPPLCLSPNPDTERSLKRRRRDSSDVDVSDTTHGKGNKANNRILEAILGLQRTVHEANVAHEASLCKMMAKIEEIEGRFKQLEQDQRDLVDEVRTHMAPLWDEIDTRLQSQEDREHVHIRDVIEEVVDENIKDKMAEAVDDYFKSDGEGQDLIHKVVGDRIQEETKDFLQNQCFTGHFTIKPEQPPI
ncbi:hypothetical protein F5B22DRAFT_584705 [Xylaria bambusicola]|uniref:uncharacterized protein n=1 Tax=Xylaria bambusicola TaxID=326684 RepID=UPI002007FA81|nr:uncharacterized protein F5B22DRAFT_584705 [Xylaria bambusicola]KAI0526178.1 hypothetical protein F5B22DRAFT_584705 [Xylaria bambusicola]